MLYKFESYEVHDSSGRQFNKQEFFILSEKLDKDAIINFIDDKFSIIFCVCIDSSQAQKLIESGDLKYGIYNFSLTEVPYTNI